MSNKSVDALKSQKRIYLVCCISAGLVVAGLAYLISGHDHPPLPLSAPKIDLPSDKINAQELWMARVDQENNVLQQKLKYLETVFLDGKKKEIEKEQENQSLKQEVARFKNEFATSLEAYNASSKQQRSLSNSQDPFAPVAEGGQPQRPARLPLQAVAMGRAKRNVAHVSKAIPSGTTVRALLVSSIDAPCGVYSNSDPQPVKLRVLDDGHLPKSVEAHLKGGLIIASAYGDISTERVYMRLERLTKVEANGEFIETNVTGFISGEDGKYGVRGVVVDKSGRIVANAAASGFMSGIGQFLNTTMISEQFDGCCNKGALGLPLLQEGGLQGASNAFDVLADYYINRAEQIKPVIQVTAGRIVDITFTHRAELGDLYTKDRVKAVREEARVENPY